MHPCFTLRTPCSSLKTLVSWANKFPEEDTTGFAHNFNGESDDRTKSVHQYLGRLYSPRSVPNVQWTATSAGEGTLPALPR
jgi:hypothetical protein